MALPVFASRVFRHGFIVVNRKHVNSAKDLAGKRIGVPLYTQTAALFVRGLMQHDLGVDLSGIEWVQGAVNEPGAYGNPSVMPMLKPVKITPNQSGKSLSDLLESRRNPRHHRLEPAAARSTAIPTWCGCSPTTGRASRIISAAPRFSRSCT